MICVLGAANNMDAFKRNTNSSSSTLSAASMTSLDAKITSSQATIGGGDIEPVQRPSLVSIPSTSSNKENYCWRPYEVDDKHTNVTEPDIKCYEPSLPTPTSTLSSFFFFPPPQPSTTLLQSISPPPTLPPFAVAQDDDVVMEIYSEAIDEDIFIDVEENGNDDEDQRQDAATRCGFRGDFLFRPVIGPLDLSVPSTLTQPGSPSPPQMDASTATTIYHNWLFINNSLGTPLSPPLLSTPSSSSAFTSVSACDKDNNKHTPSTTTLRHRPKPGWDDRLVRRIESYRFIKEIKTRSEAFRKQYRKGFKYHSRNRDPLGVQLMKYRCMRKVYRELDDYFTTAIKHM